MVRSCSNDAGPATCGEVTGPARYDGLRQRSRGTPVRYAATRDIPFATDRPDLDTIRRVADAASDNECLYLLRWYRALAGRGEPKEVSGVG